MITRMNNRLIQTFVCLMTLGLAIPAFATPIIGEAVADLGSTTSIGTGSGGWIDFYIPLNDSEVYDGTLVSDTCDSTGSGVGTCTGGELLMFLYFGANWSGQTEVTIDFEDLDAGDFADTGYFVEVLAVIVSAAGGTEILSLGQTDVGALLTGDKTSQQLNFDFASDGAFYLQLTFGSQFDAELTPNGWFGNTKESLLATAISVPEPGSLALLGLGMVALGISRRRRHRMQ